METQKHMGRGSLIKRLAAQVGSEKAALTILRKRGQVDASGKLTAKGKARDNMTAGERAIDRQSKYSGKPKAAFKYNPKTNRATKR
jgi:hypothetical protein